MALEPSYLATTFTCQLLLLQKKVQMYLFHSDSEGFFHSSFFSGQLQRVTYRENINNQYVRRPLLAVQCKSHSEDFLFLKTVPIQITLSLP